MEENTQDQANEISLLTLADDVLILILRKLELSDLLNVFDTCWRLRTLLAAPGVLKECSLAQFDVKKLRHPFFENLSPFIKALNLKFVTDISADVLLPLLSSMTNLTSLDLSYTPYKFKSILNFCYACPMLKRLTITLDRTFGNTSIQLNLDYLCIYYLTLKGLPCHGIKRFVNSCKEFHITVDPKDTTACQKTPFTFIALPRVVGMQIFSLHSIMFSNLQTDKAFKSDFTWRILSNISWKHGNCLEPVCIFGTDPAWQFIAISNCASNFRPHNSKPGCYIKIPEMIFSSSFYNAICGKFSRRFDFVKLNKTRTMQGPWHLFMWHNDIIAHNEDFHASLIRELERKVPHYICKNDFPDVIPYKSYSSNVYCISTCICAPNEHLGGVSIDLDPYVQQDRDIKITLRECLYQCGCYPLPKRCPVFIDKDTACLKNITFLHIDDLLELDKDFFKVLFQHCPKLITLNAEVANTTDVHLSRYISYAKSLKNLRIKGMRIDETELFRGLATIQLEKLYICDWDEHPNKISDVLLADFVSTSECLTSVVMHYHNMEYLIEPEERLEVIKNALPKHRKYFVNFAVEILDHNEEADEPACHLNDPHADVFYDYAHFNSLNMKLNFAPVKEPSPSVSPLHKYQIL